MSADDALGRLGSSTAEACFGVLEMFAAGKVVLGEVTVAGDSKSAFKDVPVPRWRCRSPTSTASPAATCS